MNQEINELEEGILLDQPDVKAIYFSPTGATKAVIENISCGLNQNNPIKVNLSNVEERNNFFSNFEHFVDSTDFFLIGLPVYFGRIPGFLIEHFQQIDGKGKSAIAVVVYGNRGPGIALNQLVILLNQCNFKIVGAGTFIGEHALSSVFPIALGRPDEHDVSLATEFGAQIYEARDKLKGIKGEDVPGKLDALLRITPEKPPKPTVHLEKCIDCGLCVQSCPMGIIDSETKLYKNKAAEKLCLGCMSCVKVCPQGARSVEFSSPMKYITGKLFLKEALNSRKEPFTLLKNT
ncbi:MAG: 4Fe-4S binding protein [Chloroflexi bacterium]|nr:4Fe-4S binding protein [Chloroflexota bacterium]